MSKKPYFDSIKVSFKEDVVGTILHYVHRILRRGYEKYECSVCGSRNLWTSCKAINSMFYRRNVCFDCNRVFFTVERRLKQNPLPRLRRSS